MALLPVDIQNKGFTSKMRGYDKDEVDDFLDQVVKDYDELNQKNHELEKSLKHVHEKLEYFNELKDSLNQSILVAQNTAEKVKSNAENEADVLVKSAEQNAANQLATAESTAKLIVEEATRKAEEILSAATNEASQLWTSTDGLKKEARTFHHRLILMLESQLYTVKSEEWRDLLAPLIFKVPAKQELLKEILGNAKENQYFSEVTSQETIAKPEVVTTVNSQEADVKSIPSQEGKVKHVDVVFNHATNQASVNE